MWHTRELYGSCASIAKITARTFRSCGSMKTDWRQLGTTRVKLPPIGFGGAGIMFGGRQPPDADRNTMGFRFITDKEADVVLQCAWDHGVRYYDVAPWYGRGQAEHRLGRFLYDQRPRDSFLMSTKVGRRLIRPVDRSLNADNPGQPAVFPSLAPWCQPPMGGHGGGLEFDHFFDYSYDGIMRCYEDSLQRTSMNKINILVIHDLDQMHFNKHQMEVHLGDLFKSGWRALQELKASGEIEAYGAGINTLGMMSRYMETMDMDFFLVAQVFSLLHHGDPTTFGAPTTHCDLTVKGGALSELAKAQERGMGVIAATTFNSGILVTGPREGAVCNYRPATEVELQRVTKIQHVCDKYDVPLPAAAIQYSLAHPIVASLVVGMASEHEVKCMRDWVTTEIPKELWHELRAQNLICQQSHTPL
eukprot:m.31149 g.31149  ORF g.31149 m.31149 type:complete len:418 (+) comp8286_c0_seq1:61-1314(+)